MSEINDILREIININKLKAANKKAMAVLLEQEAKISQEESVLLNKLFEYHNSKNLVELDNSDIVDDVNPDVVNYVHELVHKKDETIPDDTSDTSTEPLTDDEEDSNGFDRDELKHKSVDELKTIYASLYDRKPRGKSASKVDWLIEKIIDKAGERVVKKEKKSVNESKSNPPDPPPVKLSKKDHDLTSLDDDLDQLVYNGTEYDITKISSEESWLLIDGKQVGKIKTISGEGVFDDNDNKRVVMLVYIYEGVKYYLVDDDSDKSNKLVFNPNEEYVGLYNISKESIVFRDRSFTRYHYDNRC